MQMLDAGGPEDPSAGASPGRAGGEGPGRFGRGGTGAAIGFVLALAGVATYVAGTLSPSFYPRAPGSQASSAVSVFLSGVSPTSIGSGLMLYGGPAVVTIAALGGLLARRVFPWATAATAAAVVW